MKEQQFMSKTFVYCGTEYPVLNGQLLAWEAEFSSAVFTLKLLNRVEPSPITHGDFLCDLRTKSSHTLESHWLQD